MAASHSRSNSYPSQTHPLVESVEVHLRRLKATSTSASSSVSAKLAALRDLHESINIMIQMPSAQQSLSQEQGEYSINELLEGSLLLADLCSSSRDIVCLTKESVHHLQSSIRRNKAETIAAVDINAYAASRKKINKMVDKCLKNSNHKSKADCDLKAIGMMLKETESLGLSILKSALILLSGGKERSSWSSLLKITHKSIDSTTFKDLLNQSEKTTQELEEGLECLYRSLVKTRVSLLNVLSH